MRAGFYGKLAVDGIRKNKRLYTPFLLRCAGMAAMLYIVSFLAYTSYLDVIPGGNTMRAMLVLGIGVIAVFSVLFLFYTHSFLIRRRKKEFGLYNVLGMGKRNIAKILFFETLITAAVSVTGGLAAGIAFSKLAELGMVYVLQGKVSYAYAVSVSGIRIVIATFLMIFTLIFLNSLGQVRLSDPLTLLRSESAGEKPPKGNWFLAFAGVVFLAGAYWIALAIEQPLSAMLWFFIAVIMVIIGTYLLFISGSVVLCRLLQKKKSYYYQARHFVSVASMKYRMKRNGAGLASICILVTMVLVMISSSACLYFGGEDSIRTRYPREVISDVYLKDPGFMEASNISGLRDAADDVLKENGVEKISDVVDYRYAQIAGIVKNGTLDIDLSDETALAVSEKLYQVYFVPLADYHTLTGEQDQLSHGEAMIYVSRGDYSYDTLTIPGGENYEIVKKVPEFVVNGNSAMDVVPTLYVFVPDFQEAVEPLMQIKDSDGDSWVMLRWFYGFDLSAEPETQIQVSRQLKERWNSFLSQGKFGVAASTCEAREENRAEVQGMFGGVFYLGIVLSIVFLFAAVLIIYYKQISEGYEDQSRFEIMQKVGMTKEDIRKSINSQMLTVFFLPLIAAAVHLAFAFPLIRKLLALLNMMNIRLFIVTTVLTFLIFGLFYAVVYRLTSNAYYAIVSGAKED